MDEIAIHDAYRWGWRVFFIVMAFWLATSFCGCIPPWDVPRPVFMACGYCGNTPVVSSYTATDSRGIRYERTKELCACGAGANHAATVAF